MNKGCGNCLFQGDSKSDKNGAKILCFCDNSWYKDVYFCKNWREYSGHLTTDQRLQLAMEFRREQRSDSFLELKPNFYGMSFDLKKLFKIFLKKFKKHS